MKETAVRAAVMEAVVKCDEAKVFGVLQLFL
jgi:hypothetical protein